MTIAQELKRRREYLSDPTVDWVSRAPRFDGEACLIADCPVDRRELRLALTHGAELFLDDFVREYGAEGENPSSMPISAAEFNDAYCTSREQVLWMLDEAVDQAKFLGI